MPAVPADVSGVARVHSQAARDRPPAQAQPSPAGRAQGGTGTAEGRGVSVSEALSTNGEATTEGKGIGARAAAIPARKSLRWWRHLAVIPAPRGPEGLASC